MAMASYYLDQFTPHGSSALTLVNNTTLYNVGWMEENDKVQDLSYELPSGGIFDPHGTQEAPLIPGTVTQTILVKGATASATRTLVENFRTYIRGKRGTLRAVHPLGGTTFTCTARCTEVTVQEILKDQFVYSETKLIVKFRKITNWA